MYVFKISKDQRVLQNRISFTEQKKASIWDAFLEYF